MEQLLHWAHASSARSRNKPSKPYAIIALNASENPADDVEWDEKYATASLLESTTSGIEKNATFKHFVGIWRSRGKYIFGMKDLLECYYGTVQVVRLPAKGRLALLDTQRHQLHRVIVEGCQKSQQIKADCQMLPDADDLQNYLQSAFDHFSYSLDKPFDFVIASLNNNPIPVRLPNNIVSLCSDIFKRCEQPPTEKLFATVTGVVSSCIMLDAARSGLMGLGSFSTFCCLTN